MKVITYNEAQSMNPREIAKGNLAIVSEFQEKIHLRFTYILCTILAGKELLAYIEKETNWKRIDNDTFLVEDSTKNIIKILGNLKIPERL